MFIVLLEHHFLESGEVMICHPHWTMSWFWGWVVGISLVMQPNWLSRGMTERKLHGRSGGALKAYWVRQITHGCIKRNKWERIVSETKFVLIKSGPKETRDDKLSKTPIRSMRCFFHWNPSQNEKKSMFKKIVFLWRISMKKKTS